MSQTEDIGCVRVGAILPPKGCEVLRTVCRDLGRKLHPLSNWSLVAFREIPSAASHDSEVIIEAGCLHRYLSF